MSKIIKINSSRQFDTVLSSNTCVIADFYADWCGPCKQITPIFEKLSQTHSSPGKLAFVKVDVDNQQDVAAKYSVSAMPTFLIFKNGSIANTIRGADPNALNSAVTEASRTATKGSGTGAAFSGRGQVLGAAGSSSRSAAAQQNSPFARIGSSLVSLAGNPHGALRTIVLFLGLYFTTLFSFNVQEAAENSPFALQNAKKTR